MESAGVGYLGTSCWHIRKRTSARSERVSFLIQNNEWENTVQSTFHAVICLFYTYWDFSTPTRFSPFRTNIKSASTSLLQILVLIFFVMFTSLHLRLVCFPYLAFFKSYGSSFQTFPCYTLCRSSIMLKAYLPSLKLFRPLPSVWGNR